MADYFRLPPPEAFGLPKKFISWRPYQPEAILSLYDSTRRFNIQNQPTGCGKTLCYITGALLLGKRTLILTSFKGLQRQLESDFGASTGLIKIMGKNAYTCRITGSSCDWGPCQLGMRCGFKREGCVYYDQLRLAQRANIVLTNYAFWSSNLPIVLGKFDLLVCDEAHSSVNHLLDNLAITIYRKELKELSIQWPDPNIDCWRWLESIEAPIEQLLQHKIEQTASLIKSIKTTDFQTLHKTKQKIQKIIGAAKTQWITEYCGDYITFDPLWPPEFAESYLFRGIPKILLTSATINKEVTKLLGIELKDLEYTEYPSHFPINRRPVIHIPTTRVDHKIQNTEYSLWLSRIDQILSQRLDRKGIIHTVSYARRDRILNTSEYSDIFYTHGSRNINKSLNDFKAASIPAVLCSPSVVTGWDFPYEDCEYQIIGKIPFPDMRRKVDKARKDLDKDFGCYFAMQNLVQACGRGMRSRDDRCECLIIDDHFKWFVTKYKKFAPKWFLDAVRFDKTIPRPLPKLIKIKE